MTLRSFVATTNPFLALAFSIALIGCADSPDSNSCSDSASANACVVQPDPCPDRNPLRNPYVGELHVHTAYSFDSILAGVTAGPRDMYRFAQGERLALPPFAPGSAQRSTQLRRPLDFAAATDHAEFFGEFRVCTIPGHDGFDSDFC
ncbi:MAG: DUF3604 domain-containing protein, partial [Deltaproteobacteria bacterium]|nr:DUF3604 domain-containing protein [Deltaproteobacteria bacterium]